MPRPEQPLRRRHERRPLAFAAATRDVLSMSIRPASGEGRSRVVAVLGPTNTGKTHLAMERMLGHASGMIGFPLRLLARENYDRAVKIKGPKLVALITGEEKIIPADARYFLCTVEAMPMARRVAFLAVDEIQMCADPDRGHLFTDRLLHARGELETMFMGAETIRPLLRQLVPAAEMISRPRFSTLGYAGSAKISRLPPRSAVVAFSAADVYAIAELIRRQRGGAAVVLGALSPRTRNSQVAMYQAGEVDYLVATDAIGMGLNMNIDHVAFAATRKFDGRMPRALSAAELAQIAGRAGRHMKNGTFGTTAEIGEMDPETVERIETHRFDPLRTLFWRNSALNFTSLASLRASLARAPGRAGLIRAREADDELALSALARDEEIAARARSVEAVRLVWDICQVPDFGKVLHDAHVRLLLQLCRHLVAAGGRGRLPTDWMARQVDRINRSDGDIEALMQRIANIRTWTYIAYRDDWVHDSRHWQERTRAIEDRLSDVLHERLTQRFVDRTTAILVGRMKDRGDLYASLDDDGVVSVEGHAVGQLQGFRFVPGDLAETERQGAAAHRAGTRTGAGRAVTAAAMRALRGAVIDRLARLDGDHDEAFSLSASATILWRREPVGRLAPGHDPLHPAVEPFASDLLSPDQRERLRRRLTTWLSGHLESRLAALMVADGTVIGPAGGVLYQVIEGLGSLARSNAAAQIAALTAAERQALTTRGLRLGRESIFFPGLLKAEPVRLRGLLWSVHHRLAPPPVPPGRASLVITDDVPRAFYEAIGYRPLGSRAVRVDILERLSARALSLSRQGDFAVPAEFLNLLGCSAAEMEGVLAGLGYRAVSGEAGTTFRRSQRRRQQPRSRLRQRERGVDGDPASPFAQLHRLRAAP